MAPLERLVDRRATACYLPHPAGGLCQLGEERKVASFESRLRQFVEPGAQNIQPIGDIALLNAQDAIEATPRGMPCRQRMPCGMIKQHRHITLCCREVAYQKRYPARGLAEGIAQRKLVIEGQSILNIALGNAHGLVGESLQPKNRCKRVMSNHTLIVSKADDMQSVNRRDVVAEHSLDMAPRVGLLSEQIQREADHAIADKNVPGVGRPRSHLLEPPCKGQNFA